MRKKIPYGISNFETLCKENYIYVDKTSYIEKIEDMGKYLFFIRPRRFGKSLFVSMLNYYYDINEKNEFDELFKGLWIQSHPTPLKNKYLILKFDFSGIDTDSRKDALKSSFYKTIRIKCKGFIDKYKKELALSKDEQNEFNNQDIAPNLIKFIIEKLQKAKQKIYVLIDEYDHFANNLIAMGEDEIYKDIVRASGFVRGFYEALKTGTGEGVIDRIFITGVSPIMLDDLTSGFNISINITREQMLNEIMGFTEKEVKKVLLESLGGKIDLEKELELLRGYYNGYLFHEKSQERVYNSDMVLYYAHKKQISGYVDDMVDDNVRTDYGKLRRLALSKNGWNRERLEDIIRDEEIGVDEIIKRFSFEMMYSEKYFESLLYYMGLLTIKERVREKFIMMIPNYVIKKIYWEYMMNELEKRSGINVKMLKLVDAMSNMGYEGDFKDFARFLEEDILPMLSNRDLIQFNEKNVKMIMMTLFGLSKIYIASSEMEVEKGYADIVLKKDLRYEEKITWEWLIELKYIKSGSKEAIEKIKEQGRNQVKRYIRSKNKKKTIHREKDKKDIIDN